MTVQEVYKIHAFFCRNPLTEDSVRKICEAFDGELRTLYGDKIPADWKETEISLLVPFPFDDIYLKLVNMMAEQHLYIQAEKELSAYILRQAEMIKQKIEKKGINKE